MNGLDHPPDCSYIIFSRSSCEKVSYTKTSHMYKKNLQTRNFLKISFVRKSYTSDFVNDPNQSS